MQCFTDSGKLTMSRRSKHAYQEHEQPKKVYRAMVSAIARRDEPPERAAAITRTCGCGRGCCE